MVSINLPSIIRLLRLSLKLFVVLGFISTCRANTRYNRLDALQRSLNAPAMPNTQNEPLLFQPLHNGELEKPMIQYGGDDEDKYSVASTVFKRDGVRRCGMVLLKHIQKLCNGCVGRPRSSEENRVKRSFDPFMDSSNSLTDLCCKSTCGDAQLLEFCCN